MNVNSLCLACKGSHLLCIHSCECTPTFPLQLITHRNSLPLISLATRVCGYQGLGQILKLNERMQRLQCDLAGDIRAECAFCGQK